METYCLDTNILILDSTILLKLKNCNIIIPYAVFLELDKNKSQAGNLGYHARKSLNILKEYSKKGSLVRGVERDNGGVIRIMDQSTYNTDHSNDYNIVMTAKTQNAILLSNDNGVHVIANILSVPCKEYYNGSRRKLNKKHRHIEISDKDFNNLEMFGEVNIEHYDCHSFIHREYLYIENSLSEMIPCQYFENDDENILKKVPKYEKLQGHITPRNDEQNFLVDAINTSPIVICSGKTGSGKTLISVSTALSLLEMDDNLYHIILSKPLSVVGKDVGYLPGDLEEKTHHHFDSFRDSLSYIYLTSPIDEKNASTPWENLENYGMIQMLPYTHIRGRTLNNSIVIIDEIQNLSRHEIKTLISRIGHNSILILLGDVEQIDELYLNRNNNALSIVDSALKGNDMVSNVYLSKTVRSKIAGLSSKL